MKITSETVYAVCPKCDEHLTISTDPRDGRIPMESRWFESTVSCTKCGTKLHVRVEVLASVTCTIAG